MLHILRENIEANIEKQKEHLPELCVKLIEFIQFKCLE